MIRIVVDRLAVSLLFMTLAAFALTSRLRAQVNPDSVKLRNDCRLAEQVLTTGQPATHRREALTVIGLCGGDGLRALLSTWSSVPGDRDELELLVASTRAFATAELVDTLLSILRQPARPSAVRVASLLVLLTYADPWVLPGFDDFLGDSTTLLVRYFGHVDHSGSAVGQETVPPSLRDDLRAALQTIAASDADPQMRVVARVALRNPPLK